MRQRLTTPTTITFTAAIVVVLGMMALSGCERAEPPQWEISAQAAALRPELVTALTWSFRRRERPGGPAHVSPSS